MMIREQGILSAEAARQLGTRRYTGQWVTFRVEIGHDRLFAEDIRCNGEHLGGLICLGSDGIYRLREMGISQICKACWCCSAGGWCDHYSQRGKDDGPRRIPLGPQPPTWCPLKDP
jgi:hypothetical protein